MGSQFIQDYNLEYHLLQLMQMKLLLYLYVL